MALNKYASSRRFTSTTTDNQNNNKSPVLKLTQSPNDYALVDTTGYSKGKKSFPYTWHRSSGFGLSNKKTTSNHSFTKKELDKHIKKQNPNHRTKEWWGGAGASWKK